MKRRVFLQAGLGLGISGAFGGAAWLAEAAPAVADADLKWHERSLTGLGTILSLRLAHADADQGERALHAAIRAIRRVEAQMSLFSAASAISRLNRDGVLTNPDADFVEVLRIAQHVSAASEGAFDVTVQPLWAAFEMAARHGTLPAPDAIARARDLVGWRNLMVSDDEIRLQKPGMAITLNGIAQGFAADLVRAQLSAHGVRHALINTGEWSALGRPAAVRAWQLGIADPRQEQALIARLSVGGRCVATSADNECAFSPDRRHHHIFDPLTGYSPADLASVTVVAADCALADALTKVLFVAGRRRALELAMQWQVDALVVDKSGQWEATPGLQFQTL